MDDYGVDWVVVYESCDDLEKAEVDTLMDIGYALDEALAKVAQYGTV